MATVKWESPQHFAAMRVAHPHYRGQSAGPISPLIPLSPISLSPTTQSAPGDAFFSKSESTPSLCHSSSASLVSLESSESSTTQLATPATPVTSRRQSSRTLHSRKKVSEAVYGEGFDSDFANLLATIPSELPAEDRSPSPGPNVTSPLHVKRIPPPRSASLPKLALQQPPPLQSRHERKPSLTVRTAEPNLQKQPSMESIGGSSVSSSSSQSTSKSTPPSFRSKRKAPPVVADIFPSEPPPPYSSPVTPTPPSQPPILRVHPPDREPSYTPRTPLPAAVISLVSHAVSTSSPHASSGGRQAIVRHAPTSGRPSSPSHGHIIPRKPVQLPVQSPVQSDDKRSVRVEMVDVDAFLLHWDAPELIPAPAWLVSARAYVQGNQRADQRLVIDIHKETPPAERKWLLKLALECYLPMRERYLDVIEVFRLSMPGYPLDVLKTTPPPALPEMKRSEFKRSGLDPAPNAASLLPRVIIPSPWRNVYRLLHNISTEEPLWVPNGVLLDFTLTTHNGVKGCITLDRDTAEEAKSATMNTMLLHALRRIIGTSTLPRPDVQRAMGRCNFRRLSFNPSQVSISFVGRYGGILDINLPSPRGGAGIPVWHQPIRVYLIPGGEFSFEYAETSPDWRQDEIQQVVEDHIGVHLEAWSDIQRIIGAFAPTDPRLIKLLTKPAPLKKGYERHSFVPNVTRGAINGVTPHRLKPDSELPRLSRRRRGLYALEYPNMEPAILDCTLAKPQVYIHEQSKHLTMVIAWLFSIVGALFEN